MAVGIQDARRVPQIYGYGSMKAGGAYGADRPACGKRRVCLRSAGRTHWQRPAGTPQATA